MVITDSQAAMRADHVPAVAETLDMNEKLDGKKVYAETGDQQWPPVLVFRRPEGRPLPIGWGRDKGHCR